jgi:hypothetical protein
MPEFEFKNHELNVGSQVWYDFPVDGDLLTTLDWQDIQRLEEKPNQFNGEHHPIKLGLIKLTDIGFSEGDNGGIYMEFDFEYIYQLIEDSNGLSYYGQFGHGYLINTGTNFSDFIIY